MRRFLLLASFAALGGCAPSDPAPAPEREAESPRPASKAASSVTFRTPAEWKPEEPANKLRKFQYRVPDKQKDHADAECVVFYFGANPALIQTNIRRWAEQMGAEEPKPETLEGTYPVTLVDLKGTYAGDGGGDPIEDARMLAAIVDHPEGPWYFKLVGHAQTVGDWRDEFIALLKRTQ
jgi:hypothetical protein